MESIYVLEPGAYLRREGMTLKVVKGEKVVDQIPAEGLRRLTLIGYVSLSGGVLDFLIQNRTETIFMTPTGRYRARLALDEHRHVGLRKAQYLRLSDDSFVLETARTLVRGKIENMIRLTLLRARQYEEAGLKLTAVKLRAALFQLDSVGDLEALRGVEGSAARIYFETFGRMIKNEAFSFNGRNKRPPLDPMNALLSFVYTLLTNEVLSAIKACGLDPYLGSLHAVSYGRPSLACDLVEEYRACLGDRLVLGLVNRKAVRPEDFVYRKPPPAEFVDEEEMKAKRPVEMKPAVNRSMVAAYEEMMKRQISYPPIGQKVTYRRLMMEQVRRFAEYLEDPNKRYVPFAWEP